MRRTWVIGFAAALLVLAGCGSDGGTDDTAAPGASNTTGAGGHTHGGGAANTTCATTATVSVIASGTRFQTDCLAAPANQPFTVSFENKDTVNHNLMFLESHQAGATVFFDSDIFNGPSTKTFNVNALRPGTYAFHCKIHPDLMSGAFVVK